MKALIASSILILKRSQNYASDFFSLLWKIPVTERVETSLGLTFHELQADFYQKRLAWIVFQGLNQ